MNTMRFTGFILFRVVTAPLYLAYHAAIILRRWGYELGVFHSMALPAFTISVGNIEAGGTGKTPVVAALASHLRERGGHPVIVTRGYRSGLRRNDSMALLGDNICMHPLQNGQYHPDEALMQAHLLQDIPVIIGRRRGQAVRRYLQQFAKPTHFILDDGFQHLAIKRHTDIVLLDARAPFGNGFVFPWGRLREPAQSLSRATLVLMTRVGGETDSTRQTRELLRRMDKPVDQVRFTDQPPKQVAGPSANYDNLHNIAVATAIAKPQSVLAYPLQRGQTVVEKLIKRDHSRFVESEISALAPKVEAILTTAKDFYRDPAVFGRCSVPVFILPLNVEMPFSFLTPWLGLLP